MSSVHYRFIYLLPKRPQQQCKTNALHAQQLELLSSRDILPSTGARMKSVPGGHHVIQLLLGFVISIAHFMPDIFTSETVFGRAMSSLRAFRFGRYSSLYTYIRNQSCDARKEYT